MGVGVDGGGVTYRVVLAVRCALLHYVCLQHCQALSEAGPLKRTMHAHGPIQVRALAACEDKRRPQRAARDRHTDLRAQVGPNAAVHPA